MLIATQSSQRRTYRFGKGIGDGKDSRSRCPDELFVLALVVCSCLSTSTSARQTGAICSFSTSDEVMLSDKTMFSTEANLRDFRGRANLFIGRQYKILTEGKPRPCRGHCTER
jgi:hypothetical protein